jgi:ABC-type dipeptide/oligopeptide/nickel transport system permease subunit
LWEPLLGVVLLVLSLNLLGDAIRDALDPKTRR